MKFNINFLFNLLNKKIKLGPIEKDVAEWGLLIGGICLFLLTFLVPVVLVGIIGLTFGILSSFRWGLKGGVGSGFWILGILILGRFLNPAGFHPVITPVNIGTVFLICIIVGKGGELAWNNRLELKQTNKQLIQQKKWLNALFHNSPAAIVMADEEFRIVDANDQFIETFQYDLEEIKGKDIDQVMEMGSMGNTDRELTKATINGNRVKKETVRFDKEGNPIEVLVKGIPITIEGEVVGVYGVYEDIGERKQAERELRQQNNLLEGVINAIPDVIGILNPDFTIDRYNQAGYEALAKSPPEVKGTKCYQLSGKYQNCKGCPTEKALTTKELAEVEHYIEAEDIYLNYRSNPILNDNNQVIKIVEQIRDITDYKQTEQELKEKNNLLDGILESMEDGITVLNNDLTIQYTNEFMRAWYQEKLPLEGKKCFEAYYNRTIPCAGCPTVKCIETGEVQQEKISAPASLEAEWLDIFSYPMIDDEQGTVMGVVESVRDITEQEQAKKQLSQLLEKQELLLDNIEIQVWYLQGPKTYGAVNQAHADFFGVAKEKIEDKTVREVLSTEEEAKAFIAGNKQVFAKKRQIKTEAKLVNYQGEARLLSITRTPKVNQAGEVEYVICSAVDITEQRRAKEKIKYVSFHDELTELYNRAYLEKEMERLDTKRQLPISIIMIDINSLKLLNDTFGHEKGDQLLVKTADVLQKSCREEDIIARFGGDEFIIILPQTKRIEAQFIANRIKQHAKEVSPQPTPLSMAVGVATKNSLNQNLWEVYQEADEIMYNNKLTESRKVKTNIINVLLKMLKQESCETTAHAMRLQRMGFELGQAVDLSFEELNKLFLLVTLHDIGKVTLAEKILTKPAALKEEEWERVREHPQIGYRIASATKEFAYVAREILYHHECWDGTGYPDGLSKDKIPLLSRIIAIIDAYDVMISGRPYKKRMTKQEAKQELKECAGTQFDPQLTEVFLELLVANKLGIDDIH